jgi:hypothetical protein
MLAASLNFFTWELTKRRKTRAVVLSCTARNYLPESSQDLYNNERIIVATKQEVLNLNIQS